MTEQRLRGERSSESALSDQNAEGRGKQVKRLDIFVDG